MAKELNELGAVIKIAYEAQTNTNVFTDTEKTKLGTVNTGATANAPNAELRDRATHTGNIPSTVVSDFQTAARSAAQTGIQSSVIPPQVLIDAISSVLGTGWQGTPTSPPVANGAIAAQSWSQNTPITPINLGTFFTGGPTAITISPSTPGLTIGAGPTFTLSGTPTTARPATSLTATATNIAGSAGQIFSATVTAIVLATRQQVEGLRDKTTPNGRISTQPLRRIGNNAVPTGWSTRAGNVLSISAPFNGDIEDWDFTNYQVEVLTPIGAIRNCIFGENTNSGIATFLHIAIGGRVNVLEYNTFTGCFRDSNASKCIKQANDQNGATVQFGEIPTIRFNRFTGYSADVMKLSGSNDAAGQIIEWNYCGPAVNIPQTALPAWSSTVTYNTGDYAIDTVRNRRLMKSLQDGNLNNPVPTGTTDDVWWNVLDPHSDTFTWEAAANACYLRYNLIDLTFDPIGPDGPYAGQGYNNVYRVSRNTNVNTRIDRVEISDNVHYHSGVSSYPIQVSAGDPPLPNFNGPIIFRDNFMQPNPNTGTLFHPSTNGLVNTWTNNRHSVTGVVLAGPTLRASGAAPANTVAPSATPTPATAGDSLFCTTGTFTGDATITYAYQWLLNGVDVVDAITNTFVAPQGSLRCRVTATNAAGSTSALSNTVTVAAAAAVTVDSASLKFPDGNVASTTGNSPAYLADATNWAAAGSEIFAAGAGAFAIMVEIPWEHIQSNSAQFVGLFGNCSTLGTTNQTMGINLVRGTTDQETFNLIFRLRDNTAVTPNTLVSTLAVTKNQKRLLCVFRYQAGVIQHEIYHQGVRIAVGTPAMGTFAGTALRSGLIYGAQGNGTTGAFLAGGSIMGFNGSIQYFGYHNTGLTQTDCEAMSNGVDPLVQVTAANWRMYRRVVDTDTASLAKPAAATGDATAALTFTNARALVVRKGSNIVPVTSGVTWLDHDYISDGRVFGRVGVNLTGRIFLSGRASGLTGLIEARSFDATGALKQNWTTVVGSTIAAGVWAGYIDALPNSGWGHIDIRSAAFPTMVTRVRARTGVGLVFGALGQSQVARSWDYPAAGTVNANAGALSTIDVVGRTATAYGSRVLVVSPERPYSGSLAAVANALTALTTEPVMLMNLANPGQSTFHLQDDSNTNWNWSEFDAIVAQGGGATLANRRVSCVVEDWLTSFANTVNAAGNGIIGNNLQPLYEGTFAAGATVYTVNHYLQDNLTFPATTRFAVSPNCTDGASVVGPVDFSGTDTSPRNHGTGRGQWLTYAATRGFTVGPWKNDIDMTSDGNGSGGRHPSTLSVDGNPRLLVRMVIAALWAMGVGTKTNPSLGGVVRSGGGSVFSISTNLPNGGAVQTAWAFKVLAVPAGETSVQGFEVQDGGVGAWSRSTFTTSIAGGNVVLTKNTGTWLVNTKLRYAVNGPLDYGASLAASKLYNGTLYESGVEEGGLGIPFAGLWTATA